MWIREYTAYWITAAAREVALGFPSQAEPNEQAKWAEEVIRKRAEGMERLISHRLLAGTCWQWTGPEDASGYGLMTFCDGTSRRVHLVSYELFKGPIPAGLDVDHLCRNTGCFNPIHLEAVTPRENARRAFPPRTHCPHGHPYTPENTYFNPSSKGRTCRTCAYERKLKRKEK